MAIAAWFLTSTWGAHKQQLKGELLPVDCDSGESDDAADVEDDDADEIDDVDDDEFGLGDTFMGFRKGAPSSR